MTYAILKSRNSGATIKVETIGFSFLPAANCECEKLNRNGDGWNYYPEKIESVAENDHIDGSREAARIAAL
jgi:hypothetical protein